MKDVLDVVAAFPAGLRALDIRVSSVALSREDGRRFAAALQDEMRRLGALGATERLLGAEDSGPARQFWRRLNG